MIKVGSVVRVKGANSVETAKVELFIGNVKDSVFLNKRIGGFQYWDTKDLEEVITKGNHG